MPGHHPPPVVIPRGQPKPKEASAFSKSAAAPPCGLPLPPVLAPVPGPGRQRNPRWPHAGVRDTLESHLAPAPLANRCLYAFGALAPKRKKMSQSNRIAQEIGREVEHIAAAVAELGDNLQDKPALVVLIEKVDSLNKMAVARGANPLARLANWRDKILTATLLDQIADSPAALGLMGEMLERAALIVGNISEGGEEEPYSLSLVLNRLKLNEDNRWDAKILATDTSTQALRHALRGEYSRERLAPISPANLLAYFKKAEGGGYRVGKDLQNLIKFGRLNLLAEKYPFRGPFDFIFCRNVMIYFDHATREKLVNHLHSYLAPGGHLLVGHSESLSGLKSPFNYLKPAVYQRAGE